MRALERKSRHSLSSIRPIKTGRTICLLIWRRTHVLTASGRTRAVLNCGSASDYQSDASCPRCPQVGVSAGSRQLLPWDYFGIVRNPAVGEQMFTRRVFAGCAIALLAASGVGQEHQHGKGEKLGAVHFDTSCNAEAQTEFDRAVALLHSFQF